MERNICGRERIGETDYCIKMGDISKVFHVNMLKRYYERHCEGEDNVDSD